MYKFRVYCASGWFTDNQKDTYEKLSQILHAYPEFDVFYPKSESKELQSTLHLPATREEIFNRNLRGMAEADLVVCSTEDKDTGSIFEAGFSHAMRKPIIYVNFHLGKAPFNLMLTESSLAVARDANTFERILQRILEIGWIDRIAFAEFRKEDSAV